MAKHVFQDQENKVFEIVPDGDYEFEVIKAEFEISSGGKTGGSDIMKLSLALEGKPGVTVFENLIFHPSCDWKVDTFMKCCGMQAEKGTEIEFVERTVLGLRGVARVRVEDYKKRDGSMGKSNKVACFYTDKKKLPKRSIQLDPAPVSVATDDDEIPF